MVRNCFKTLVVVCICLLGIVVSCSGCKSAEKNTADFTDFVQLMDDALSERKDRDAEKWKNREISEWYEDYNGDRLQIIDKGYKGSNVQGFQGIVYYQAAEDEMVEGVVVKMLNAVMDTLMTESEDRTFVVTDYYIPEQELTSWDSAVSEAAAACWEEFGEASGNLDEMNAYIEEWMSDNIESLRKIRAVPDDMWYFIPGGYYRFEGFDLGNFHEAEAQQSGEAEGMVGFWNQGSDEGAWMFVLMKYGNVYRLQKMSEM